MAFPKIPQKLLWNDKKLEEKYNKTECQFIQNLEETVSNYKANETRLKRICSMSIVLCTKRTVIVIYSCIINHHTYCMIPFI